MKVKGQQMAENRVCLRWITDNTHQQNVEDNKKNKHPEISVCHVQTSPQTHQGDQGIQVQNHGNL